MCATRNTSTQIWVHVEQLVGTWTESQPKTGPLRHAEQGETKKTGLKRRGEAVQKGKWRGARGWAVPVRLARSRQRRRRHRKSIVITHLGKGVRVRVFRAGHQPSPRGRGVSCGRQTDTSQDQWHQESDMLSDVKVLNSI